MFLSIKASSPKRKGTRMSVFFLKETTWPFSIISAINNLIASEPISIAPYLISLFILLFQIMVSIQLGPITHFIFSFLYVSVIVCRINYPCFGIIAKLEIKNIFYFLNQ